jgi:hypothetical protein
MNEILLAFVLAISFAVAKSEAYTFFLGSDGSALASLII